MQPKTAVRDTPGHGVAAYSGASYLQRIKNDGRRIFIDGEEARDVTAHPAFREGARTIANLWDIAFDPALRDVMTFLSPTSGRPVVRMYEVPKSIADLRSRHRMIERWAEATFGLMGRTPDHVAGFLSGFVAKPSVFERSGPEFSKNVVRFHEYARDNHLYLSYAIVPPQIDRSKPAHKQSDPTLYAGVVKERDDGIVLRGAQQLATGAVFSDYLYLSCIHPLQPGDEAYAIGVVIPMSAAGLKIYTRRSYASAASSAFDYPLASRFDETDSMVVLDNVFVPWENVFVYRDIALCRDQWWKTPSHSYGNHQAQIRYATKLRFFLGVTKRICEITGVDSMPPVQVQLGEMAALASIVDMMVAAQEAEATIDDEGVVWPSKGALYAVMSLQSELNSRIVDMARELSGGSLIMLPSSMKDFENESTAADLERYVCSPGISAKERVAVLKMAWDLIGSEFAGRHQQYEKFYGGASFLVKQNMYRTYDFARARELVERALGLPPVAQNACA